MAYTSYYDDFTGITHYENFFTIKIQELDPTLTGGIDTQCFIVYDSDEDMFYLYGSRKHVNDTNYCIYQKRFSYMKDLFSFLNVVMNLDFHKVNIIIYHIPYVTSDADFDTFAELCSFRNEISGYNNIYIRNRKMFLEYLSAIIE